MTPQTLNQTELLERPYWKRSMIWKMLGSPDKIEHWTYRSKSGTRNLYAVERVIAAEASSGFAAILEQRTKRKEDVREIPLLVAIREVSRAAHRWRDAAQSQYQSSSHGLAGYAKEQKH